MTKFSILVGVLFFNQFAFADSIDSLIDVLPNGTKTIAILASKILPANQRQGVGDYLAAIGTKPNGGMNTSIQDFNYQMMQESPCLRDIAGKFYNNINLEDVDLALSGKRKYYDKGVPVPLSDTPDDYNKKPGWLWEKAMTFANGNKLLAMEIIGICGHDNKMQISDKYDSTAQNSHFPISLEMQNELQKAHPSEKVLKNLAYHEAVHNHNEDSSIEEQTKNYEGYLTSDFDPKMGGRCPHANSEFYGPKALGENVAIPDDLKTRIIKVQAPTKGGSSLPGKNYHFMGAAFTSCLLLRHGVPAFIAQKMAMGAMEAYRSTRMCDIFGTEEGLPLEGETVQSLFDKFREMRNGGDDYCNKDPLPLACKLSQILITPDILTDPNVTDDMLKRMLTHQLAENDAVNFFRSTNYVRKTNNCEGPQLGGSIRLFLSLNASGSRPLLQNRCPAKISNERCASMRGLLDTYLADMQWSEAEHRAGFDFAKENCPAYDPVNTPEMAACKILHRPISKVKSLDSQSDSGPQ